MNFLDNKNKRRSALITLILTTSIFYSLYFLGLSFLDPPTEYGLAVNFGSADSDQTQRKTPSLLAEDKTKPQNLTHEEIKKPTPKTSSEKVITQEDLEALAIKKRREEKRREEERKILAQQKLEERKRKEREEKRKSLDELLGKIGKADANERIEKSKKTDNSTLGNTNGNPYTPSYFGDFEQNQSAIGYGLSGRGKPSMEIYKQDCNQSGLVVVKVEVDRQGRVIRAVPGIKGTTNSNPCLLLPAKKIAMSFKWKADNKAPTKQIGFVSIHFILGK